MPIMTVKVGEHKSLTWQHVSLA